MLHSAAAEDVTANSFSKVESPHQCCTAAVESQHARVSLSNKSFSERLGGLTLWLPLLLLALQAQVGILQHPEISRRDWLSSKHLRCMYGHRPPCLLQSAGMNAAWMSITKLTLRGA